MSPAKTQRDETFFVVWIGQLISVVGSDPDRVWSGHLDVPRDRLGHVAGPDHARLHPAWDCARALLPGLSSIVGIGAR